jgi:hypothetical protein
MRNFGAIKMGVDKRDYCRLGFDRFTGEPLIAYIDKIIVKPTKLYSISNHVWQIQIFIQFDLDDVNKIARIENDLIFKTIKSLFKNKYNLSTHFIKNLIYSENNSYGIEFCFYSTTHNYLLEFDSFVRFSQGKKPILNLIIKNV